MTGARTLPSDGVLLVDKPEGWTSHDVVAFMRPLLGTRRVGHGGTLDPFASGLLVLVYGRATRLAQHLHTSAKSYLGEIVLGNETTTDDREGEPTETTPIPELDDPTVLATLASFLGPREQVPPAFSAIRVQGEHAYAKARRGERVILAPRPIEIHDLVLVERGERCVHVLVTCSAGTYVRALARDVGRALGARAHLGALRRIASGALFVEDAVEPAEAKALLEDGALAPLVFAPDAAAFSLPGVVLAREAARRLLTGQHVGAHAGTRQLARAYDVEGTFVGIAEVDGEGVRPVTILGREAG